MAINATRSLNNFQKRSMSVGYFAIDYTDIVADVGSGTILFVVPNDSIIIHLGLVEDTPANAGANVNIDVGNINIITNGSVDSSGIYNISPVHLENGGDFIISQGATPPTQGTFSLFVIYIEHDKHTGEYTNFSGA